MTAQIENTFICSLFGPLVQSDTRDFNMQSDHSSQQVHFILQADVNFTFRLMFIYVFFIQSFRAITYRLQVEDFMLH
jgi:hypothetical protein